MILTSATLWLLFLVIFSTATNNSITNEEGDSAVVPDTQSVNSDPPNKSPMNHLLASESDSESDSESHVSPSSLYTYPPSLATDDFSFILGATIEDAFTVLLQL